MIYTVYAFWAKKDYAFLASNVLKVVYDFEWIAILKVA